MKVPVSWLREYVPLDMPLEDLAERLSVASAEVPSLFEGARETLNE